MSDIQAFANGQPIGVSIVRFIGLGAQARPRIQWRPRGYKHMGLKPHIIEAVQLDGLPPTGTTVGIHYETTW